MGQGSAAVKARIRICQMARDRRVGDEVMALLLAELGVEVLHATERARSVRLAKLPRRAVSATVVVDVALRPKRRYRA